ncbi:hypothetical protein FQZ97_1081670 [compost metagenome]
MHQGVVVAAHQHQVRAAVDGGAGAVLGQALGAVVAGGDAGYLDLADAVGLGLLEVLFQHQAPGADFLGVLLRQGISQLAEVPDHQLATAGLAAHRLQACRTALQQGLAGTLGIAQVEYRVAMQDGLVRLFGKPCGPARRHP